VPIIWGNSCVQLILNDAIESWLFDLLAVAVKGRTGQNFRCW